MLHNLLVDFFVAISPDTVTELPTNEPVFVEEGGVPTSVDVALISGSLTAKWFLTLLATVVFITSNLKHIPGIFSPKIDVLEKDSMYECGFEPFGDSEEASESHFILIGVLFVLFDLELVLLIPMLSNLGILGGMGILLVVLFLLILIGGLVYEWFCGILN